MNINYTYCDDHFIIYKNIKSLHCIPKSNITLQVNYISILEKQDKSVIYLKGAKK